eukprot:8474423-Heterocapsa_arctica.AAC.1
MLGYDVGVGGKWHGDHFVSPFQDFKSTNTGGTLRIFHVKEVVVDTTNPVKTSSRTSTRKPSGMK